ncbi:MAG: DUF805 domain-containing protein [Hyphomonadaceae bacterium]
MDLTNTLFNPNGRLSPGMYWRGYIYLIAVYMVFQTIQVHGGSLLMQVAAMLGLMMIWPFIALTGKRLHDSGRSAWWVVPIIFGMMFVGLVVKSIILMMMISPDDLATIQSRGPLEIDLEMAERVRRMIFLPGALVDLAVAVGAGYLLAGLLSDRRANQYGPSPLSNDGAED